ncbi:MAG: DUF1674 domain-containing protein [Roseiarcus sp.]
MSDDLTSETSASEAPAKPLGEAAKRALAEAEERRRQARDEPRPREYKGRGGPDPARYGDWEVKGHAVDF